MEQDLITSAIEAVIFSADKPITIDRLKDVLGEQAPHDEEIKVHLEAIKERYQKTTFGFELREAQGGFHFVTKPCNGEYVRRFLQTKPFRLGRSTLETLAIIAYRQPITRSEIDQVRGIDSSHLMRSLIERGLVKMAGKAEVPGRPVQYATTQKFLEVTGLASIGDLPPLAELEQLQGQTEDPVKLLEENLQRFIDEKLEGSVDNPKELDSTLVSIDEMIQSANQGTKEVHASPIHAEIAQLNEQAVEGMNVFPKVKMNRKKKAITFEELNSSTAVASETEAEASPEVPIIEAPMPENTIVN